MRVIAIAKSGVQKRAQDSHSAFNEEKGFKPEVGAVLIGGMLPVIGGLSVTPFSQARRDQPTRFPCRFAVSSGNSQREAVRSGLQRSVKRSSPEIIIV